MVEDERINKKITGGCPDTADGNCLYFQESKIYYMAVIYVTRIIVVYDVYEYIE